MFRFFTFAALAALSSTASAQTCTHELQSLADGSSPIVRDVSIEGREVIFGHEDNAQSPTGRLHQLELNGDGSLRAIGWIESPTPAGVLSERFGERLSRDGDQLLVSERVLFGPQLRGVAHVMRLQGGVWQLEQTLEPPGGGFQFNTFGNDLAIHGDTAFLGAPNQDDVGNQEGAVHVFERGPTGWVATDVLRAMQGSGLSRFGSALDFDGERLVVGAPRHGLPFQGAVFVFERVAGAWTETAAIVAANSTMSEFGTSVAIEGNVLVGGAPGNVTLNQPGFAQPYELRSGTWIPGRRLSALSPEPGGGYGNRVAYGSGRLAVLHFNSDSPAEVWGQNCAGWQRSHVLDSAGVSWAVDVSSTAAVLGRVGALRSSSLTCTLGTTDCDPNTASSTGLSARLRLVGSSTAGANDLTMQVSQLPPGQFGIGLVGPNGGFVPPAGACFAELCIQSPIARLLPATLSDPQGEVSLQVDLTDIPAPVSAPILPGETWHFQYWTRNPSAVTPSSLSNAVSLLFE